MNSNKIKTVFNLNRKTSLALQAVVADCYLLRLRGLLFTRKFEPGKGLYLVPCSAIHMFGMSYAIDAIFLDKQNTVIGLVKNLKPWRISPYFKNAFGCLELPAGTISSTGTAIGDKIEIRPAVTVSN